MSLASPPPAPPDKGASPHGEHHPASARADLKAGVIWMLFGIAVLVGSIRMDRLESQDINPYTVPGLLPGLLGIVTTLLGFLLFTRSLRRVRHGEDAAVKPTSSVEKKRIAMVLALCLVFGVVLVGHGLPFWAAAALFVSVSILFLQQGQRKAAGLKLTPAVFAKAVVIGLGAGAIISVVFQELFLVHLP